MVGRHAPILAFTICSQFFNNLFTKNLQFIQIPGITNFYQSYRIFPFVIMHKNIAIILCNFFSHFLLTNYPDYDIIDTERGENKSPREREIKHMRVEKDLSKMTKIAENEKYDFYVRKFGKTDWYAYAMEKGTNIAVTMAGTNRMKSIVEIVNSWAGWMK